MEGRSISELQSEDTMIIDGAATSSELLCHARVALAYATPRLLAVNFSSCQSLFMRAYMLCAPFL